MVRFPTFPCNKDFFYKKKLVNCCHVIIFRPGPGASG
jgi:hypothetical protein